MGPIFGRNHSQVYPHMRANFGHDRSSSLAAYTQTHTQNLYYIDIDLSTPVPLYKYVDDSTLFEICEFNSISLMQESVNIAAEWTINNDMKINSEKSKEIIISYAHGNIGNEVPNILIEGNVVERVDHVKLLGITLSNDLTWRRHVDNIVKTAGKRIFLTFLTFLDHLLVQGRPVFESSSIFGLVPCLQSVGISSCLPVCCPSNSFSVGLGSVSQRPLVLAILHRCGWVLAWKENIYAIYAKTSRC